jgi:predicted O-linked N-acetylglucosamine transferase (SPINDLY family)
VTPGDGEALANLFLILRRANDAAVTCRSGRIALRSGGDWTHWAILAEACERVGEWRTAAEAYAAALERHPESADLYANLSRAQQRLRQPEAVRASNRRAVVCEPAHVVALANLGALADGHDDPGGLERWCRRASAVRADDPAVRFNRARLETRRGRRGAALREYRLSVALDPGRLEALNNLADVYLAVGDASTARWWFQRCLALAWAVPKAHSNLILCLTYLASVTSEELYRETRRWEARHALAHYASHRPHDNDRDPERRLKIGYLSADLRAATVAETIGGVLDSHDPASFEVFAYAEVSDTDGEAFRRRHRVDRWRSLRQRSDDAAAAAVRRDGIDIIVSLAGHTGENRPTVLAYRPAPVQVSMYDATSSGMSAVDAWMTDPILHPPTTEERFAESLVRIPSIYLYATPADVPVGEPPCAASERVVFASFNNPAKIDDATVDLWAKILRAVPNARLLIGYRDLFGDQDVRRYWRRRLADRSVPVDRVTLEGPAADRSAHLDRFSRVDIALDPFPFNGSNTSFEALWQGVPVVTLLGERFVSRTGASLLTQIGFPELIARSPDDYVRIAVALAKDRDRLAAIRSRLRPVVAASLLCDPVTYTRSLEAAYRDLWRRWCRSPR